MATQEKPTWMLDEGFHPYEALYIHVPFCKRRCHYCDFHTQAAAQSDAVLDAYLDTLVRDIRHASAADLLGQLKTVYIGGGTPSHLGLRRLSNLLYTLSLSMHLTPEVECTLEANPESLTLPMVKDLFALGVTRLSLGVQSFDDAELAMLGRVHDADTARQAIEMARERFEHVSIDLMCGLPGQTLDGFLANVETALTCGVDHISVYPLTIEDGTVLCRKVDKGELPDVDPDLQAQMMEETARLCEGAGMRRYEVANYAKPGCESRHNSAYWQGVPYLGLGPGAVGMKQSNTKRVRYDQDGVIEELDARQMIAEDLMLGMRLTRGVSADAVLAATFELPDAWETFERLVSQGFVRFEDGRFKPTKKGWLLGNQMYGDILELAP